MKKLHILLVAVFIFTVQTTSAQFGLKKLKNNVLNSAKNELNKKKDSLQNATINNAFSKITDLCVGKKKTANLTKINSSNKAYAEYQNLKKGIDKLKLDLKNMELLKLMDDSQTIMNSVKTIKKIEPNADLSSECNRITNLKQKFIK
ncbi:hypothetical protein [Polaribacter aestuariivivens]|uniref:hypothetical protein n=1 Tax=Polaribacter aestuariivivens TaxID=2304626 RepID=UPI003F497A67